jgi:AraC-like DNA-binding protein
LRDHPIMAADPLSDMLDLMNAQSIMSGGLLAGGRWALRFPPPDRIKLFAVVRGTCWITFGAGETPLRCDAGDVFLLAARRPLLMASDPRIPATEAVDAERVFSDRTDGIARHNVSDGPAAPAAPDDFFLLGGHVKLDPQRGVLLYDVLPPLIHVRAAAPEAAPLQWLLGQLVSELAADRPGALLASAQLTQLILVQILRAHLAAAEPPSAGWLRALGDPRIAPALQLIHGDPGHAWQLTDLARAAAMSRTMFALRFKAIAGVAPLTYLLRWRMRLAERALRDGSASVSALARSLGYSSDSAFSNAFKRATGVTPKRYRTTLSPEPC